MLTGIAVEKKSAGDKSSKWQGVDLCTDLERKQAVYVIFSRKGKGGVHLCSRPEIKSQALPTKKGLNQPFFFYTWFVKRGSFCLRVPQNIV